MGSRLLSFLGTALVCLSLSGGLAFSQAVNATILGNVMDAAGGVVPGAKVTITDVNTGVSKTGLANESGNYTFPDLPPGVYSVTVEKEGFKKETRARFTLEVNSSGRVDMRLSPG